MTETLEFIIRGQIDGVEITPSTIGLSQFNEFNLQAEQFISGRTGGKLDTAGVEIKNGSYVISVVLAPHLLAGVDEDVDTLSAREDALNIVDPKRAEIVRKWQTRASAHEALTIEVRSSTRESRGLPALRISSQSNFRVGEAPLWIPVEKYLFGSVEEMGGARTSNIHLRVPGIEKLLVVDSDKDALTGRGVLYTSVLLRVRAKENVKTGELKDLKLIEFADYHPEYDEAALDRFAEAGKAAWSDIPDGEAWLRELRGG